MKKYEYVVYVGRFQPCHNAHIETIKKAIQLANKQVIIVLGSAFQRPDFNNPFTWKERASMIGLALGDDINKVKIVAVGDHPSDEQWARDVQDIVYSVTSSTPNENIGIIGLKKDATSFYLNMFPQWNFEEMPYIDGLNASDIRAALRKGIVLSDVLPPTTAQYLSDYMRTDLYSTMVNEYNFIQKYKDAWSVAPYAPTFVTADAVVIQSGHILLIRRKSMPGQGALALPGGFVGQDERIRDAAIRELREETRLKVPTPVLNGSITYEKIFDKPNRSLRGRTITVAFLIELVPGPLPKVKGSDDAREAFWMPLAEAEHYRDQFFEDHFMIIQDLIGKLK